MLRTLWADQAGFVVSTELVLVVTILVLGMVVGLSTVRDSVVQELGDLAMAIGAVNESYAYGGVQGHSSAVAGSHFQDQLDFCESAESSGDDAPGIEPACIDIQFCTPGAGGYNEDSDPWPRNP